LRFRNRLHVDQTIPAIKGWLAPDVARLVAEIQSVVDGMADVREVWPEEAPPEPRRTDVEQAAAPAPPTHTGVASGSAAARQEQPAAPPPASDSEGRDMRERTAQPNPAEPSDAPPIPDRPMTEQPPPIDWTVPADVLGQDAIIMRLVDFIELAQSDADLDAIEQRNADRISRITGTKGATLRQAIRDRRLQFKGGA
jgi:hypothetical protein